MTLKGALFPLVLMFSVFCMGFSHAQLANSPWPMYQHDARHTGQCYYAGPDIPVIKWKFRPGMDFVTNPEIDKDGFIYVGLFGGTLCAINPDKSEKWRYQIDKDISSKPVPGDDGTIYFGSGECIYALSPNGALKWSYSTGTKIYYTNLFGNSGEMFIYWGDNSPPPSYEMFHFGALNKDGTLKWKIKLDGSVLHPPAVAPGGKIIVPVSKYYDDYYYSKGYSLYSINSNGTQDWCMDGGNEGSITGSPVIGKNGVIYFVSLIDGRCVNAVNADGSPRWQFDMNKTIIYEPLVVKDDSTLLVLFNDVEGEYGNSYLMALDSLGLEKWRISSNSNNTPVLAEDGTVYFSVVTGDDESYNYFLTALNPDDASLKWSFQTDDFMLEPPAVAGDGTIYAGAGNLYAVSPDGEELWKVPVDDSVYITPEIGYDGSIYTMGRSYFYKISSGGDEIWRLKYSGDKFQSKPAVGEDGTIYVGSQDRFLYAVNPDGSEKWNVNLFYMVRACPAIGYDGTVYVGSKSFYAIDLDQSFKWSADDKGYARHAPAIDDDGNIYYAPYGNNLYSIKPDGYTRWNVKLGYGIESTPAISNYGKIYINSGDKHLYSLNKDNGSINWSYNLNNSFAYRSPSIATDGTVYFASREGESGSWTNYFIAFNPDGLIKWKYEIEGSLASTPLISLDDTIYFGADYSLFAMNPDGSLKWKYEMEDYPFIPCLIDLNGVIYTLRHDQNIYAVNPDGTLKWTFGINFEQDSSLAMGADGTIYVCTDDEHLTAIGDTFTNPRVDIYSNRTSFYPGETAKISVKVDNPSDYPVDMYAAVMLNGLLFFYPSWTNIPRATEISKGVWEEEILSLYITSVIPGGSYNFYAAITAKDTLDVIDFDVETIRIIK